MALSLVAKGPNDVVRYSWKPSLAGGDGIASFTLTASGCTIDSDESLGDEIVFYVSGGTTGTTASIAAGAVTNDGETLKETLYLPIFGPSSTVLPTVRDVCSFALRKITGNGEDPEGDELDDAVERLNDMLLAWRTVGADVGATFPLVAATELTIRDDFVMAIKYNLKLACHEHYGEPITPYDVQMALASLALVKNVNIDDERAPAGYY